MSISAMKQALEALENVRIEYDFHGNPADEENKMIEPAITALRQSIAEAEKQEPVAWWNGKESVVFSHDTIYTPNWTDYWTKPLYADPTPCRTCEALSRTVMMDQTSYDTAPPKHEWVGLTDKEAWKCWDWEDFQSTWKSMEAKLKEKNT